jgi:magnesium transporter
VETGGVIADCATYDRELRQVTEIPLAALASDRRIRWVELVEPTDAELDLVGEALGLHELAVEDAVEAHQRPKLEVFGDALLLVLKTARISVTTRELELGELLMFLGHDFVVVVRHGRAADLTTIRQILARAPSTVDQGPAAVLHAIVDEVIDDYGPVVDAIDDAVEGVEDVVFSDAADNLAERIHLLKRQVLALHRVLTPLVEPLAVLASQPLPQVPEGIRHYFRDAQDHLLRLDEQNTTNRELLNSVLEANLAHVSVRQNEDMRKISAWVAIAAVPTVVAGIYGMNFEHMPELGTRYGYAAVLLVLAVACLTLHRLFRRSGWL